MIFKGELQRRSKLILIERPLKILQNETKIIKIRRAVLEIFNFNVQDLDNFQSAKQQKTENVVFIGFVQTESNRLCDVGNAKCTIEQKNCRIFPFLDRIRT